MIQKTRSPTQDRSKGKSQHNCLQWAQRTTNPDQRSATQKSRHNEGCHHQDPIRIECLGHKRRKYSNKLFWSLRRQEGMRYDPKRR